MIKIHSDPVIIMW